MPRVGDGRRARAIGATLAAVALLTPTPAGAAGDEIVTLPPNVWQVVAVDFDGDGEREFVTLSTVSGGSMEIQRWTFADGIWRVEGRAEIGIEGRPADASTVNSDGTGLLVVRDGARERLLALASSAQDVRSGTRCCLRIWELAPKGGRGLGATRLDGTAGVPEEVRRLDVDGDGVDELLVTGYRYYTTGDHVPLLEVLRRTPDGYTRTLEAGGWLPGIAPHVVDADGRPGDELMTPHGATLRRHAWVDDRWVEETTDHPAPGADLAATAGETMAMINGPELSSVRWPAGDDAQLVGLRTVSGLMHIGGLGDDAGSAFVMIPPPPPGASGRLSPIEVLDARLETIDSVRPPESMAQYFSLAARGSAGVYQQIDLQIWPWAGALPTADRTTAVAGFGVTVAPDEHGGHVAASISPFVGRWPTGVAGPGDGWMSLGGMWSPAPDAVWLWPNPTFGDGYQPRTRLVPMDRILQPASPLPFDLGEAVLVAEEDEVDRLVAPADGFAVGVALPPGSELMWRDGREMPWRHLTDVEARQPQVVRPSDDDEADGAFQRSALIVDAAGHVQVERWEGIFVDAPPRVEASGTTIALEGSATIEGHASSPAQGSVMVDGRAVTPEPDGGFRLAVDAGLLPRTVEVTAVDLLGQRTIVLVEVVGFADYRLLPWPALAAVATLAIGAVMFLRVPRQRRTPPTATDGDGQLEDLDDLEPADELGPSRA